MKKRIQKKINLMTKMDGMKRIQKKQKKKCKIIEK